LPIKLFDAVPRTVTEKCETIMTRLKAAAECKIICDKLQEEIQQSFLLIGNEEFAYRPGVAWLELDRLREKLLVARKELGAIDDAMRRGDSVVAFKIVA
jgi:hypothetical protein